VTGARGGESTRRIRATLKIFFTLHCSSATPRSHLPVPVALNAPRGQLSLAFQAKLRQLKRRFRITRGNSVNSTTINVIGLFLVPAKWLFPSKHKDENQQPH
jgi:hypothetical protein